MSTTSVDYDDAISVIETPDAARRKEAKQATQRLYDAVAAFHTDRVATANQSARRAWIVAGISTVITFMSVGAVTLLTPLKKPVPFVLRVDQNTGYTDIAPAMELDKKSWGNDIDKFWLGSFVINRESYDWESVQTMYDSVQLLSSENVMGQYKAEMMAKNGPVNLLGKNQKIVVSVSSVSFFNDIAQIRYTKSIRSNSGQASSTIPDTEWIATVTFDYKKNIRLEKDRIRVNPLGFRVTSWRTDPVNVPVIESSANQEATTP